MDTDEKDLNDMDPIKRPADQLDTEKHPRVHDEKNKWGDKEFSFDSIWDRLPHISLYQVRVMEISKLKPSTPAKNNNFQLSRPFKVNFFITAF